MLGNLRISFKLLAMVLLAFAGIAVIALIGLLVLKSNLIEDRKAKLRDVVQLAVQNAAHEYQAGITAGLTEQAATERTRSALRALRFGNNDYFFAYDPTGVSQVLPDPKTEGQARWDLKDSDGVYFVRELIEAAAKGGMFVSYRYPRAGSDEPVSKLAYSVEFKANNWIIGSGIYIDDVDAIFRTQLWRIGSFVGVTLLLVIGVCLLLGRSITRPVNDLTRAMRELAGGSLDVAVPDAERRDELGEMARAVMVFKENAMAVRRLQTEQEVVSERALVEKQAALIHMADKIENETTSALHVVAARTTAMTATADEMTASAARTGNSAQSAASASAQALANAQTVASAAEQLSASIREISAQVAQSSAIVGRAVAAGSETRATIEALNEQVARIGAVADMIGEIAAKTNLLALNATIEAARAGDAGKGFAVVASEVKALATQTARSTQEIAQHISQVRSATGASVAAVTRIERTIGEIDAIAGSIAAAVEEQGAATAEIARNVTETASAAHEMTSRTTEVEAEAEQTGRHAAEVRDNAAALNTAIEELRHSVIHVVRTSATEVDRRLTARHPVDLPCRLSVPGHADCSARVTEISEAGASVHGGPSLRPGARGLLRLDGADVALPFAVRGGDTDALHLMFELDAVMAAKFGPVLGRLAPRRVA